MTVSSCRRCDADTVERLVVRTFSDAHGEAEGRAVGALAGELLRRTPQSGRYGSAVRSNDHLVGSILLSRLRFESAVAAFLLAPVAIRTDHRRWACAHLRRPPLLGEGRIRASGGRLAASSFPPVPAGRLDGPVLAGPPDRAGPWAFALCSCPSPELSTGEQGSGSQIQTRWPQPSLWPAGLPRGLIGKVCIA
ncbi:protein of unknown function [Cyanobium sp. NIES-981]|nr:protein of unknown function [Cyanobium sp. NIES-981]